MSYSTAEIAAIKVEYPSGTRIKLNHMDEQVSCDRWHDR